MSISKKTLIIGGVAGGASTAAKLRRLDENAEIIMLERGEYISYANCGLPYFIGDVITEREALLLQTPEAMKGKFNIDVRTLNEAVKINPDSKTVTIKNHADGTTYEESYDNLVIATGSSPVKPPIPGIDGEGIHTLWTVPDTDKIKAITSKGDVHTAAVIGGGFIGLEMAENLHAAGIKVSLIEAQNQVMAPFDSDMAQLLHKNISDNGVELLLGDGVKAFSRANDKTIINLTSGKLLEVDLVILAIGVRPNSALAKEAGIELNAKGGIKVNERLETSIKDIYAVGDVIEVGHFVTKEPTMIPLAGPANKQGRICANIIAGLDDKYEGTLGTSVAKVFDLTAASVGINEKALIAAGKVADVDYHKAIIVQKSHAGYYPGAMPLMLKALFDKNGKIFGAQIVGVKGADKRIDTIATVMRLGGTVHDLTRLELAYAPPYSSAKDPVNMLGFVAENVLNGHASFITPNEMFELDESTYTLIDVREQMEVDMFQMPNALHMPFGTVRNRLEELDRSKLIVVTCAIGVRAYNVARILQAHGFENVKVLTGGTTFFTSITGIGPKPTDTPCFSK